uniref:tyrosine-type recombinase/integrase n=1 Tax=Agathobacter sp. TaxID=2021311 RepID=UPI00405673AE
MMEKITLEQMLDIWMEEALLPGDRSNNTVTTYASVVKQIKKHPISRMHMKEIEPAILQAYIDLLSFGGIYPNGKVKKAYSRDYVHAYMAVLQGVFKHSVYPKGYLENNPMQFVEIRKRSREVHLFSDNYIETEAPHLISAQQWKHITAYLKEKKNPALLPMQIAYYAGLRLGEACALTWNDVHLEEQYLIVRRSVHRNGRRKTIEIGPTKNKKPRIVDFGEALKKILIEEKKRQIEAFKKVRDDGVVNYYKEVREESRIYYELHKAKQQEWKKMLADKKMEKGECEELSLVCLRKNGAYESPDAVENMCRAIAKQIKGLKGFHFHMLRHTYTTNLLLLGATPKEMQELLGHSDVNTTMNIYAHATRDSKKNVVRLLDSMGG